MIEANPELFLDAIIENVKKERKKRKISQLALSQLLNFSSPNYIAKIETKKHNVSYNIVHLCKIAVAFNMSVVDFFPKE